MTSQEVVNVKKVKEVLRKAEGIIFAKWVSDDPECFTELTDLFEEQKYGLPDYKSKGSAEQAIFNCKSCEHELKSVMTLSAHCGITEHKRTATQKNDCSKEEPGKAVTTHKVHPYPVGVGGHREAPRKIPVPKTMVPETHLVNDGGYNDCRHSQ